MAEHIHKSYTCDRCKVDLGDVRPKRSQQTKVVATFDWLEGPGPNFHWLDLCDGCDRAVKVFFGV